MLFEWEIVSKDSLLSDQRGTRFRKSAPFEIEDS